jgi:hypothetical protein
VASAAALRARDVEERNRRERGMGNWVGFGIRGVAARRRHVLQIMVVNWSVVESWKQVALRSRGYDFKLENLCGGRDEPVAQI